MSKQTVNVGTNPNDNTGDSLRLSFQKTNSNIDEIYADDFVTSARIADSVALGGSPTTTTQSAGDNSTKVSTTAYADAAVAAAIDAAPAALDTLNELAASLNDDADFAGSMTTSLAGKLATTAGAVGTANLAADAVNGDKIADDSINSEHYAAGSIDTDHIADSQITTGKIANDAVTADKIADSINSAIAANTAKLTNATHTGDVTGSGALTIVDDKVITSKILDANVTTAKIADDAVTADKLANSINTEITANTAKVTNATHTGEVTGSGALTIASDVVDADNLKVTGNGTSGQALVSDGDGTFSWTTLSSGISVSVISGNTNAASGYLYVLTADLTLTLPSSPSAGDYVKISNRSGVATCIVARNSEKIMGGTADLTLDKLNSGFEMVYSGTAQGWILIGVEGTAA